MHYYSSLCVFVLSGYFLHIAATTGMYSLEDNSEHSDNQKYITLVNRFRRQVGTALSGLGSWITGSFGEDDLPFEKFQEHSKRKGRRIITPVTVENHLKSNPKLKPSQMTLVLNKDYFVTKEKYIKQQALNAKYKKPIPPGCHVEEGLEPALGGSGITEKPTAADPSKRRKRDDGTPKPSDAATPAPQVAATPAAAATAAPTTTTEIPLRVVCPTTTTSPPATTVKTDGDKTPAPPPTPDPATPAPATPAPATPAPATPAPATPAPATPAPS